MPENESQTTGFDWRLASFEGARREQLRRWAQLPLENILLAIEEMQDIARLLGTAPPGEYGESARGSSVKEPSVGYGKSGANHDVELTGCIPEPLMAYLKALGILRLVSEQTKDPKARGWWENDVFWLRAPVLFKDATTEEAKRDSLVKFFLEKYQPTPIVVPWSGKDFFAVSPNGDQGPFSKTPTGSVVVEALLGTDSDRLAPYREAIRLCLDCLKKLHFTSKRFFEGSQKDKNKSRYLQLLRSVAPDAVVDWIDTTTVIGHGKAEFSSMLGSGGGSDGNTHFSDNFMQNLWEMLPDFNSQRQQQRKNQQSFPARNVREDLLGSALFLSPTQHLVEKRTSALYDSGAVGGANATQGLRRESLSNPWNVILLFEGTLLIAGAMSKRSDSGRLSPFSRPDRPAFPFQFDFTPSHEDRSATKESTGREIWLPVWPRPATHKEIATLFGEGRAEVSRRPASNGTEMAQAAATLGVDRGVSGFRRYAIVKGRVGEENYNTAASLGVLDVREQEDAHLLAQVNEWLSRYRYACAPGREKEKAPRRFLVALDRIDSGIFAFCKYGGKRLFQGIVIALGRIERELGLTEGKFKGKTVNPIPRLSSAWMDAADDGSPEFRVARALVGIHHASDGANDQPRIGPLRANLEPVDWKKRCSGWAEKDRAVVWNSTDLTTNLMEVLQRRMMDCQRAGCEQLPLASRFSVPLDTVAAFLDGELDDQRIADLMWGLMLIDDRGNRTQDSQGMGDGLIPRAYALLKLLFLPRPLVIERNADRRMLARLLRDNEQDGIVIRPEPSILPLLHSGRIGEACMIAMRRLRASGLDPMPRPIRGRCVRDRDWRELDRMSSTGIDSRRLAAVLLIPIRDDAVNRLVALVIGGEDMHDEQIETIA